MNWSITKDNDSIKILRHKWFFWFFNHKLKKSCQIAILILATLTIASSFNYSSIAIVILIYENENSISTSNFVLITSASYSKSITIIDDLNDYMTISITNVYENQLSLFFAFNVNDFVSIENLSIIILFDVSFTHYAFSIKWVERIYVELNINSLNSKIEDNFTNSLDIDVNYVDDYFMFITYSFENITIFDCNIDLFKQSNITCNNQVDDFIYLNFA